MSLYVSPSASSLYSFIRGEEGWNEVFFMREGRKKEKNGKEEG